MRHGGTYGGYRAEFTVVPSADVTIAILCNIRTAEPYVLKNRIIDVYLGDRLATPTPAAAAAPPPVPGRPAGSGLLQEAGDLPGTYFSEELDVRWTVQPGATSGIALSSSDRQFPGAAARATSDGHTETIPRPSRSCSVSARSSARSYHSR